MIDVYRNRDPATGRDREVAFTTQSAGVGDAGKGIGLGANGRLDESLMPIGVGADLVSVPAFEALSAGDFVALSDDAGTLKARKASAAIGGLAVIGFVRAGFAADAMASIYPLSATNDARSGLTPGARYYLSDTTPGGVVNTPVVGAGKLHQFLGMAISPTLLLTTAEDALTLAG